MVTLPLLLLLPCFMMGTNFLIISLVATVVVSKCNPCLINRVLRRHVSAS